MLRARKPEAVKKRLKLFMFGPAGVGKTTAAIQFPNSYIIDGERGTENYDKLITASGSAVFQTTDVREVIAELRGLLTEKHAFRTLVIDPITPIFNDLLDKCEAQVGDAHGRHYGAANKTMRRMANLIMNLDMNVIVTAHAKAEYGENLRKIGYTFDGWKQLDYWFDLVVELGKKGKKRMGQVKKTRIETFPDEDVFEWSYDAIKRRYDAAMLEREAATVALATDEQVREIKELINIVRLPEGTVDKWFAAAQVSEWVDMPADTLAKCIDYVKNRIPAVAPSRGEAVHNLATPRASTVTAADAADIEELIKASDLPPGTVEKWFESAKVTRWEDMPVEKFKKCFDYVGNRIPAKAAS